PPGNLELLARGANEGGYGADMTYYRTSAGGGVFSAGSMSFGGSLVVDTTLQHIVRNVLDEYLQRNVVHLPPAPPAAPSATLLMPNTPNPFARSTTIRFALSRGDRVRLRVFDVGGRVVRRLLEWTPQPAQVIGVDWDGLDDAG